jgi:putative transposase
MKMTGERMRTTEANQAWSLEFVADQLMDGRRFRTMTIVDVHTREILAIEVDEIQISIPLKKASSVEGTTRDAPTP